MPKLEVHSRIGGNDIESHGMQHRDLRLLSFEQLEHEIAESKECLEDYGLEPTFFQIPNNRGANNSTVLKMVSRYFDFALSGHSRLMFLNCDGWVNHGFRTQSINISMIVIRFLLTVHQLVLINMPLKSGPTIENTPN